MVYGIGLSNYIFRERDFLTEEEHKEQRILACDENTDPYKRQDMYYEIENKGYLRFILGKDPNEIITKNKSGKYVFKYVWYEEPDGWDTFKVKKHYATRSETKLVDTYYRMIHAHERRIHHAIQYVIMNMMSKVTINSLFKAYNPEYIIHALRYQTKKHFKDHTIDEFLTDSTYKYRDLL